MRDEGPFSDASERVTAPSALGDGVARLGRTMRRMRRRLGAALVALLIGCTKGAPSGAPRDPVAAAPVAPASSAPAPSPPPAPVEQPRPKVVAFQIELGFACALVDDGRVACTSEVDGGRLAWVPGLPPADRLRVGADYACARAAKDSSLWCWGIDHAGQLGRRKPSAGSLEPAPVLGDDGQPWVVDDFVVGSSHTCVLSAGERGLVHCWGNNIEGECGTPPKQAKGAWVSVLAPRLVFRGAKRIYGGAITSCAVDAKEQLFCWGDQDGGYSGHGSTSVPKRIAVPGRVKAMSFASGHSCVLLDDGKVLCRGWNPGGELGSAGRPQHDNDGTGARHSDFQPAFTPIPELPDAYLDVAAARHETCVVTADHRVVCIGSPDWRGRPRPGQCVVTKTVTKPRESAGSSVSSFASSAVTPTPTCIPTPDADFANVVRLASTMGRRCTLDDAGVVRCIGYRIRYGSKPVDDEPLELSLPQ